MNTQLDIPDEAVRPLAAFLWGKRLAPEYPQGGDVRDIALELLRKSAPLILAAELERMAEMPPEGGPWWALASSLRARAAGYRAMIPNPSMDDLMPPPTD